MPRLRCVARIPVTNVFGCGLELEPDVWVAINGLFYTKCDHSACLGLVQDKIHCRKRF